MSPRFVALLLVALALAGCNDNAPEPTEDDTPRQSVAATPHVPVEIPFSGDLQAYGLVAGPEGRITTVTYTGYSGVPEGNLTRLLIEVTIAPPALLPVRLCLREYTRTAGVFLDVPAIPCVEGTAALRMEWSNVTAGVPSLPGSYRVEEFFSDPPQTLGVVEVHVEGTMFD